VSRLLFLDFDGVVHPQDHTNHPAGWFRWLPILANLLTPWPDVKIVVHSSWRYEHTDAELRDLLGPLSARFAGSAPRGPREQAIESVLQANKSLVQAHLVLDDDAQEFTTGRVNLVVCDALEGLTQRRIQDHVRRWLKSTAEVPATPSNVYRWTRGYGRKVLYLDYDGVLHNEDVRWHPRRGVYMHPPGFTLFEHAALLDELLLPFQDLDIVLSTTWVRTYGCHRSANLLPPGLRRRVIGATFHSRMDRNEFVSLSRGQQVFEDSLRRRPGDWFAIDDVDEGWPTDMKGRVVLTDATLGISSSAAMDSIRANLHRMYAPRLG
jgi:HAD domain in Swiss Army Knife RNA repair proteins